MIKRGKACRKANIHLPVLSLVAVLILIILGACDAPVATSGDVMELVIENETPEPTSQLIAVLAGTPEPTLEPTPTPSPKPAYAKIGAVGDIMIMQSQISGAWNKEAQKYDFTPSFYGMQPWFSQTDILIANLETPLAGEDAGYSIAGSTRPTPRPDGTIPDFDFQTFNAPDDLASSLLEAGFNAVTTANNHCLDRGAQGLFRTAEVLRNTGLVQVGSYLSEDDRNTARVIDANGIDIGLVSWAVSVNRNDGMLTSEEQKYAIGRTTDKERMKEDIRLAREAGAEYIVAYLHWDVEFMEQPRDSTRKLAIWLLEEGVDAVLGSHPHVVQPIEYVSVKRGDDEYTGLVAYSLGNFISNMSSVATDYGAYVELVIEKTPEGNVSLYEAGMLPLYCIKHKVNGRTLHEVLPALRDEGAVTASGEITGEIIDGLRRAREYVLRVCGGAVDTLG